MYLPCPPPATSFALFLVKHCAVFAAAWPLLSHWVTAPVVQRICASVLRSSASVQALVNLGNCKFERATAAAADSIEREELLAEARGLYEAAAKHEPDCMEALYNLGLAAKAAEQYDVALEQFILLNGLLPNQVCSRARLFCSNHCRVGRVSEPQLCCRACGVALPNPVRQHVLCSSPVCLRPQTQVDRFL